MSTARYGDGSKYGQAGLMYGHKTVTRRLTWGLLVDWDNDGRFTGENDAGALYDMQTQMGRQSFLTGNGQGFEPVQEGMATIYLRNDDRRYDPFNPGSPLYGDLLPGRKFQLIVRDEVNDIVQPVMTGRIKDIKPLYGGTNNIKFDLVNEIAELKKATINTGVMSNLRYDDAIESCLAAFGWVNDQNLDRTLSEAMPYWWAGGGSAFDEISSLVDAALGMWCVAEDGTFIYLSRLATDALLFSLTEQDILWDYPIQTPMPWETVRNRVRVYARTRLLQGSVELWRMADVMIVPAGQSVDVWATHSVNSQNVVARTVTAPAPGTDYTANSLADGTGTDLTANIVIHFYPFAQNSKMTIINNGAVDAWITLLKLRGDAIVPDNYTFSEGTDDASIQDFGEQYFEMKSDWLQDVNTAIDEKNLLLLRLSTIRQFPRVKIGNRPDLQFGARLFGRITVNFASKNIGGDYRIGWIKHKWVDEIGDVVETEIYLEPNLIGISSGAWVFPITFPATFA